MIDSQLILISHDHDRQAGADLVHCVHCGAMHAVASSIAGLVAGTLALGYCARCDGIYCPQCSDCVPIEQRFENLEAGRLELAQRRVQVAMPHMLRSRRP